MATTQEYLDLITSAWREKPKFAAMIEADVSVQVRVQNLLLDMMAVDGLYDIHTAIGKQLDILGEWIGFSREIRIPIEGVFFSWDADYTLGWEFGVWQDFAHPAIYILPDDVYRNFLLAKIVANHWNGTTTDLYIIFAQMFPQLEIFIQDNQDMSFDIVFFGAIVDSLTLALLTNGYFPIKPEGVRINEFYIPIDTGPVFGWDMDTYFMKGWEEGSWTREVIPT